MWWFLLFVGPIIPVVAVVAAVLWLRIGWARWRFYGSPFRKTFPQPDPRVVAYNQRVLQYHKEVGAPMAPPEALQEEWRRECGLL
jgi:hypothetical protein